MKYFNKPNLKLNSRQKGFSLIEVLISVVIFAFISLMTTQALKNQQNAKSKVDEKLDTYQAIRSSFAILRKDLCNILNLNPQIDFIPFGHLPPSARTEPDLVDPAKLENYIETNYPYLKFKSFFFGEATSLNFSSVSHFRLYGENHESEQAEVGYFIEKDRDYPDRSNLFRRESPVIDDKPEAGGSTYVLLEDLAEVKFRYYDAANDQWQTKWDSNNESTYGELPDLIELTLIVNSRHPNRVDQVEKIEITTNFRPLFRNSFKYPRMGGLPSLEVSLKTETQKDSSSTGTIPSTNDTGGGNPSSP